MNNDSFRVVGKEVNTPTGGVALKFKVTADDSEPDSLGSRRIIKDQYNIYSP